MNADIKKREGFRIRWPTLLITNSIKLAGLYIAINEAILRPELRPSALGLAAFMMAGAQVSEEVVMAFISSFLGRRDPDERD